MRPLAIKLKNFLAYGADVSLDLRGIHLACLTGPNGAGKSSLLDAITWALWGKARASRDEALIRLGASEMEVQLDFSQDNHPYRVTRKCIKTAHRTRSELQLFSMLNGQPNPLSESVALREREKELRKILRLDYETFVDSAFLQQGKADSFTIKTPGERKEILGEILGLNQWGTYEERAKDEIKRLKGERGFLQGEILRHEAEQAKVPDLRAKVAAISAEFERLREAERAAHDAYNAVAAAPEKLRLAQNNLQTLRRGLDTLSQTLRTLEADYRRAEAEVERHAATLAEADAIRAGVAQLAQARADEQRFTTLAAQFADLEKEREKVRGQLSAARADLEAQARALTRECAALKKEVDQGPQIAAELAQIEARLRALSGKREERDGYEKQKAALAEEAKAIRAENERLKQEMNVLKGRITVLETDQSANCPVCGGELDDAGRTRLIDQYKREGTERGDQHRANDKRLKQIADEEKHLAEHIKAAEAQLAEADRLNKQAGSLQATLAKATQTAQLLVEKDEERTKVQHLLASESYGADIRARLADLDGQIAALGYDKAAHDAARQAVRALSGFELRAADLARAEAEYPAAEARRAEIFRRGQETNAQFEQEQVHVEAAQAALVALEQEAKEAAQRRAAYDKIRAEYERMQKNLYDAQQELRAAEDAHDRIAELRAHLKAIDTDIDLYNELVVAFGKKGVPAMIIEAAIPELEEIANELLSRMTDGRMHLQFKTQQAKASGDGVIETLEIMVSDELGQREYELYSGGEGFRVNFALRVGLSKFLARRAGARLQTLFIDEGFGSQDLTGRDRIVDAINAVRDDFDLILVVTHIEELRERFPTHIEVQKRIDGSTITIK